jgi:hypothetical protein
MPGRQTRAWAISLADADDILDAAKTSAVTGISSQSSDGVQTTAMDPLVQIKVADKDKANSAGSQPHFGLRMTQLRPGGCG